MKVLILASKDNCTVQMAAGWLRWLEPQLEVYAAGITKGGELDSKAVVVMKEGGVDIADAVCNTADAYLVENWDFVVSLEGDALLDCVRFTGRVKQYLPLSLTNAIVEGSDAEYISLRTELRNLMFDFYLQQALGRETLGADSCGLECDF